jgi:acetolactate decarboxylase
MSKQIIQFIFILLMLHSPGKGQITNDGIFYSSLNYSVRLGQFDGVTTLKQLKEHGDFGIGGQHGLAGELVYLNGVAYRIPLSGKAEIMPDSAMIGFAAFKYFKPENKWTVATPLTLDQLQLFIDSVSNTNLFAAIKISGSFTSLKYKIYYPQKKPYPPVLKTPVKIFDSTNIQGTMVGFFTPMAAIVLNPNYHFHFINSYGTSGGHMVDCVVKNVTIEVDYADELHLKLPPAAAVKDINLNAPLVPFK